MTVGRLSLEDGKNASVFTQCLQRSNDKKPST